MHRFKTESVRSRENHFFFCCSYYVSRKGWGHIMLSHNIQLQKILRLMHWKVCYMYSSHNFVLRFFFCKGGLILCLSAYIAVSSTTICYISPHLATQIQWYKYQNLKTNSLLDFLLLLLYWSKCHCKVTQISQITS